MWICPSCGQPGDDQDRQCEMCGHVRKKSGTAKKVKTVQSVKPVKSDLSDQSDRSDASNKSDRSERSDPSDNSTQTQTQASRTFQFEAKTTPPKKKETVPPPPEAEEPAPPVATKHIPDYIPEITPEPEPVPEESEKAPPPERPFIVILKRLSQQPRHWVILGALLIAFMFIPYGVRQVIELGSQPNYEINKNKVESELQEKFDLMIEDTLADKLEWARLVLRNRVPTRFPEELTMEVDKQSAEVKYDNEDKSSAYYSLLVSYHFEDDHQKTFRWYPVTFFFEIRSQAWTLIGDRWVRESEIIFE